MTAKSRLRTVCHSPVAQALACDLFRNRTQTGACAWSFYILGTCYLLGQRSVASPPDRGRRPHPIVAVEMYKLQTQAKACATKAATRKESGLFPEWTRRKGNRRDRIGAERQGGQKRHAACNRSLEFAKHRRLSVRGLQMIISSRCAIPA
jgi:hypothetical protein